MLLAERGRGNEAFRLLTVWAEQQPWLADPKIELARLYEEFGDRAAAKERLVEAVRADPQNGRSWAALGRLREETGQSAQALWNYQRSLQLDAGAAGGRQPRGRTGMPGRPAGVAGFTRADPRGRRPTRVALTRPRSPCEAASGRQAAAHCQFAAC